MKKIVFAGRTLEKIKDFPDKARREAGFRIIYIARFEEAVYTLHAFQKKTQKTNKSDIDVAKKAYKMIIEARKQ